MDKSKKKRSKATKYLYLERFLIVVLALLMVFQFSTPTFRGLVFADGDDLTEDALLAEVPVAEEQNEIQEETATEAEPPADPGGDAVEVVIPEGTPDETASAEAIPQADPAAESEPVQEAVDSETADLTEAEATETPAENTEPAEQKEAEEPAEDEEQLPETGAGYVENEDLIAIDVQGKATESEAAAAEALIEDAGLSESKAKLLANRLYTDMRAEGDPEESAAMDGTWIGNIYAKWVTEDTIDNGDASLLYIKPGSNADQTVKLQIGYELSGEFNYGPGDVTITVPASMFEKRGGGEIGTMVIPYPAYPSTKDDFNWIKKNGNIILTNTRTLNSATEGFIEFAFAKLTPSQLIDMAISNPFSVHVEVTTNKGNTIGVRSKEIRAQFDTEAEVKKVTKQVYGKPEVVSKSVIPANQRVDGEDYYVRVIWYITVLNKANTVYTLDYTDVIPDEFDGFIIGATSEDGLTLDKTNVYTGAQTDKIMTYTVQTAYPYSQFKPDTDYEFHNSIKFKNTEVDPEVLDENGNVIDEQKFTEASANAKVVWNYTDPKHLEPDGHYMIFKNGNDDTENGNMTHKILNNVEKNVVDLHMWDRRLEGWYGKYPSGVNEMQDIYEDEGEDGFIRLSYTLDSVGYVMPWEFNDDSYEVDGNKAPWNIANYTRPVKMTTTDYGLRINRKGEALKVHDDYEYLSVEFPEQPYVYRGVPNKINEDGSWYAQNYRDGTFLYYRDYERENWPDIDLELLINGEWVKYATASWKSEGLVITLSSGSTQTSPVIDLSWLSNSVDRVRTVLVMQNEAEEEMTTQAGISYDIRVVTGLKTTNEFMDRIETAFESSNAPNFYIYNRSNLTAEYVEVRDSDEDPIVSLGTEDYNYDDMIQNKDGYNIISGYKTDLMVYPTKTSSFDMTEVDTDTGKMIVHYKASVEERSFIHSEKTYTEAVNEGRLTSETSGVWRDLLPEGMTPILSDPDTGEPKIIVRENDEIVDVKVRPFYNGSRRTLLEVYVNLENKPTAVKIPGTELPYYSDIITIEFDALIDIETAYEKHYFDNPPHNVISFESSNDTIGTIEGYSGETDDPYGTNNVATAGAFKDNKERDIMTDLDSGRDTPSFVYAGCETSMDYPGKGIAGLHKDVEVNNDEYWSSGVYYGDESRARNVYLDGDYAYRIKYMPSTGTEAEDIILYDSLENFIAGLIPGETNDEIDIDAPRWRGTFKGVDVSQLEEMGIAPVVYYSTIPELPMYDYSYEQPQPINRDLNATDSSGNRIWIEQRQFTGDLSEVKAVAIDATYAEDGSKFRLKSDEVITAYIRMHAPDAEEAETEGYFNDDAHAYNAVSELCTLINTASRVPGFDVASTYTKVGLEPYDIKVTKRYADNNDNDGYRPDSVTIHLYANGEDTLKTLTLPYINPKTGREVWTDSFTGLAYVDGKGNKIDYSIVEDVPKGYKASIVMIDASASAFLVTNRHIPETVNIDGSKIWKDDIESNRPNAIQVKLYAKTGPKVAERVIRTITVRPDALGNWSYAFNNLPKYENGYEIQYRTEETPEYPSPYVISYDGNDIINTYHPYGDLYLSKEVMNLTEAARELGMEFTFNFYFTRTETDDDGNESEVPVMGEYAYEIRSIDTDDIISSGFVKYGDQITIDPSQYVHVKEIDQGVNYEITEEETPGYVLTSKEGDTGTIIPNTDAYAYFVNTYKASASIQFSARKALKGHDLQKYKFRFDVYEEGSKEPIMSASNDAVDDPEGNSAPVTFGEINFTEEDDGKIFTYTIVEHLPEGAIYGKPYRGYIYDDTEYVIRVLVEDNGDGTMTITYLDENGEPTDPPETAQFNESFVFNNSYAAYGDVDLNAFKNVPGARLSGKEFEFELSGPYVIDSDGTVVLLEDESMPVRQANEMLGPVIFPTITYDQDDAGKVYYYAVREIIPDDAVNADGVTFADATPIQKAAGGFVKNNCRYNSTVYGYKVEVTDNGDGNLNVAKNGATPEYTFNPDGTPVITAWRDEGSVQPEFVNTLEPGGLSVTKLIQNPEDLDEEEKDKEFHFTVKLIGDDIEDREMPYIVTDAEGNTTEDTVSIAGGQFSIDLKADETALFDGIPALTTYQVWEETPEGWMIINSSNISGNIIPGDVASAVITNRYQPDVAMAQFYGTKMLDNVAAEGHQFVFTLTDDSTGEVIQRKTNTDGGFILFDPISYTSEDAGKTFTYTIVELKENFSGRAIQYDTHEEKVSVTVTEENGVLSAKTTYDKDGVVFNNTTPPGDLKITKIADTEGLDKDTINKEFYFRVTLRNEDGKILSDDDEIYWYVEDNGNTGDGEGKENPGKLRSAWNSVKNWASETWEDVKNVFTEPLVEEAYGAEGDQASGQFSNGLTWAITADGKLVIGTEGDLYQTLEIPKSSVYSSDWPWYRVNSTIKRSVTSVRFDGKVKAKGSLASMFYGFNNLKNFDFSNLDTSEVTNVDYLFQSTAIETFDLRASGLNFSSVTRMGGMFYACSKLTKADFSRAYLSSVTSIHSMFYSCTSLTDFDFTDADLESLTDTSYMFQGCTVLESYDPQKLDTSKVKSAYGMFRGCTKFQSFDLAAMDLGNATNINNMFYGCSGLTSVNVNGANTRNVTNMNGMFTYCTALQNFDFTGMNTASVQSMSNMFESCKALKSVNIEGASTGNVTSMSNMFKNCTSLESFSFDNLDLHSLVNVNNMFEGCTALQEMNFTSSDLSAVKNLKEMFKGCTSLETVNMEGSDFSSAENLSYMFTGCTALTSLNVKNTNLGAAKDLSYMLNGCTSLTSVEMKGADLSSAETMSHMFNGCTALTTFDMKDIDMSSVKDLSYLFSGCTALSTVSVTDVDFGAVTTLSYMFDKCTRLTSFDFGDVNLRSVTDISYMFNGCTSLNYVNFTEVDMGSVENMSYMFNGCTSLTNIEIKDSDFSSVKDLSRMFKGCSNLKTFVAENTDFRSVETLEELFMQCRKLTDVSFRNTNLSSAKSMKDMFRACAALRNVDLSGMDTGLVEDMSGLFAGCEALASVDLSSLDTSSVKTMNYMFGLCQRLTSIDLSNMDTGNVTDMASMFYGCQSLTELDLSDLDTHSVVDMSHMFTNVVSMPVIDISSFDTSSVTNMQGMFEVNNLATRRPVTHTIRLGNIDTSKVEDMSNMFHQYYVGTELNNIDLENLDTGSVKNMEAMFENCTAFTKLDISTFDTGKVENMRRMFGGCSNVESINLSGLDLSSVQNMAAFCSGDKKLKNIDFTGVKWAEEGGESQLTNLSYMFDNCISLETIDFNNMQTENVTTMGGMFDGCSGLVSLDLSSFVTPKLEEITYMFRNCSNLQELDISNLGCNGSRMTLAFQGTKKLERIHLGENFRFVVGISRVSLETPPTDKPYTGKWVIEDNTIDPLTPAELTNRYDPSYAGWWVWDVDGTVGMVRFNPNGGTTTAEDVVSNDETVEITMPNGEATKLPHFTLKGWTTNRDGSGTSYAPDEKVSNILKLGKVVTLYAQWEPSMLREYTVNYYVTAIERRGYSLLKTVTLEADYGTVITTIDPLEGEHLIFNRTDPELPVTVAEDDSTVINAYYDRETCTLTFNGNEPTSGYMDPYTKYVGINMTLPENMFRKTGYLFIGWNTEQDGSGTSYIDKDSDAAFTEDTTLYAQWIKNENPVLEPTNGEIIVHCKAGQTIVIPELPDGTTYTIEELTGTYVDEDGNEKSYMPSGWSKDGEIQGSNGRIFALETSEATARNRYSAEGWAQIKAKKVMEGRDLQDGEFEFRLYRDDGDGKLQLIDIVNNTALPADPNDYSPVSFNPIHFTEADIGQTYTYIIEEVASDTLGSTVVYDKHSETVYVTVSDGGGGILKVEVKYDEDGAVFTNSVAPGSLSITKNVVSGSPTNGQFDFMVQFFDADGNELEGEFEYEIIGKTVIPIDPGIIGPVKPTKDTKDGDALSTDSKDDSTISSGETFTLGVGQTIYIYDLPAGTEYIITELDKAGWTLVGENNVEGMIVPGRMADHTFTNEFRDEISITLEADKTLVGKDLTKGMFQFEIYDEDGTLVSYGENDENGHISFLPIYYTSYEVGKGKTYNYTVSEIKGEDENIIYDETVYDVTVEVTPAEDGSLSAKIDMPEKMSFKNTYSAKGSVTFEGTKSIQGREMTEDDIFTFEIREGEELIAQVKNDATGKIKYPVIEYTYDPVNDIDDTGVHTYTVTETSKDGNGITVDTMTYTVTVTVSDNGDGTLKAETSDNAKSLNFVNTYGSKGNITFEGTKSINGRALRNGDEFTFEIRETGTDKVWTATNDSTGKIAYPEISYTLADVGTHTYTVTETSKDGDGITVDTRTYTVTVTVTDNGDGTLKVETSNNAKALDFVNTYAATGSVTFEGTKTITGRAMTAQDIFTFRIAEGEKTIAEVQNDATGKIAYPEISYTLADVGTHTYTVTETSTGGNGITVDTRTYTVTVTVTDNGDGTLKVETSNNAKSLNFINTYEATGKVTFEGTKSIEGREMTENDIYTFEVSESETDHIWRVQNDATGKIAYPEISYTLADVGTHTYTVTETSTDGNGITVDTNAYTVTVTVTDKGDGTLKVEASDNAKTLNFVNSYSATGNVQIEASKQLLGRILREAEFEFELYKDGKLISKANNDNGGKIVFDKIEYTIADAGKSYEYVVKEVKGNIPGVTYDENEFKITVTITDNGDGTLSADVKTDKKVEFVNPYNADGKLELAGTKKMTGRALTSKDIFEFTLSEGNKVIQTVNNGADGKIAFEPISYTIDDVGTHTYTVKETAGNKKGVTYDKTVYTIKVEVKDNGDGTLKVTADKNCKALDFTNEYKPEEPPTVTPKTGDTTNVMGYAFAFTASLLVLMILFRRKKTDK